jgi:hypothetical protein
MVESLIFFAIVFAAGAILLLERRSIGQNAFVQPLVLCLLAGIIAKSPVTAVWIGISLQLLSVGQAYYCNWTLSAFIGAAAIIFFKIHGISIMPGSPQSMMLLLLAILTGIAAQQYENHLARVDSDRIEKLKIWKSADLYKSFTDLVHKRILRGLLTGGLQSTIGAAIVIVIVWFASGTISIRPVVTRVVMIAIPSFGVAVTLGSLADYRYIGYTAAGAAAVMAIGMLI